MTTGLRRPDSERRPCRPADGDPPHRHFTRWIWGSLGVLILIQVLVPLITLDGARTRILRAMQAGLGRQVYASTVHLHLLPLPGVELDNVRLSEDPAFGAESMVIADDATAAVRLWPLLRGRLVFARIHLDSPSINLVRNRAGEWNIAALLERVSRPGAASAAGRSVAPQPFPYLEWSDARINFKLDQTKTRFYLSEVQGSLAHDQAGWRLQASFVPVRTDLNLSNTGQVTVDGRWPDGGGGFRQRPFAMEFRLSNSYLAGSSALLAGHDAGVHGVLDAQVHVQGPGGAAGQAPDHGFQLSGTVQARSVRRWDLLPPPATVRASFSGTYDPSQDRFVLDGLGDPGWHHLRLQGEVRDLFTHPSADLNLDLRQFSAANLLPVVMAVKDNLPGDLRAVGTADGTAHLHWLLGQAGPALTGKAEVSFDALRLSAGQDQLQLAKAQLVWTGGAIRMLPAAGIVQSGRSTTPVQLSARADHRSFRFQLESDGMTAASAAALARMFGLRSPWPRDITGTAVVDLDLGGAWPQFREAGWSGTAKLKLARFAPPGGDPIMLNGVSVTFADPQPVRIHFSTSLDAAAQASGSAGAPNTGLAGNTAAAAGPAVSPAPVTGTVLWAADAEPPVQFTLQARRLSGSDVWGLLHPPPADLVQRVFGGITPTWLQRLSASGDIQISDLDWHGVHAGVRMQLSGAPGLWKASQLKLALGRGEFDGAGRLEHGVYQVSGAVASTHRLRLAPLLARTPYGGDLTGLLAGSLQLSRDLGAAGFAATRASGSFDLRQGQLVTSGGNVRFERFAGTYRLREGVAVLDHLIWQAQGGRWAGQGTVHLNPADSPRFQLQLSRPGRGPGLVLSGPLAVPPTAPGTTGRHRSE